LLYLELRLIQLTLGQKTINLQLLLFQWIGPGKGRQEGLLLLIQGPKEGRLIWPKTY